jgi:hypothetical protein
MLKSRAVPLAAAVALFSLPGDARERVSAQAFLGDVFSVTAADLTRIDAGRVVSRTLDSANRREVATLGVVRIKITPEYYVEKLRDIVEFKKSDAVLQIGTFSQPPTLSDVAGVTLDEADFRLLRGCRVGDCGVRLPAEAINRFRAEVDWRHADARERALLLMRRILVDYVTAYMRSGAAASVRYADQSDPVDLDREVRGLVGGDKSGWPQFPGLARHVLDFNGTATPGTTDVIYWSKEKVASRNVVSVTHLAIAHTAADSAAEYAVASKQIYGTHYFDASLGLTVLLRDATSATPAIYVAYLNRSRIDLFDGLFGGVTRNIVSGKARGTVSEHLGHVQQRLERQFSAAQQARRD